MVRTHDMPHLRSTSSLPVHAAIAIRDIKAEKKGSKTNAARTSVEVKNNDRNGTNIKSTAPREHRTCTAPVAKNHAKNRAKPGDAQMDDERMCYLVHPRAHSSLCRPAIRGRQQRHPANQTKDSSAGEETNEEQKVHQETDAARTNTP
jgi:hypothetical protein